ncbi:Protein CNPPD1 [Sarcoptes scabiei]|uniref:Protein CNPPD1 n=1 Tax=Sarcoptes scabiei TaxID=52283 RepID=A0A834R3D4_SARSC|nr:Protein CNPPD1 [Sarcoptes scabiei]
MHLSIENQINESRSLLFQHLHHNLPSIDDGQDLDEILDDSYEKDEYCSHESSALQSRDFKHRLPLSLTEVTVNLIEKTLYNNRKRLGKLDVNYAAFILNQACLSPTTIIMAVIYLDRLKKSDSDFLSQTTSTEIFLASLIVASKFLFDKDGGEMVFNDEWASFANLDLTDLNKLEREFLNAINWSCFVDPKTFAEQVLKLEGLITLNEYSKRKNNSITYVEMITFFKFLKHFRKDDQLIWENIIEIFKSILICSIAYFIAIGIVITSISLVLTVQNAMIRDSNRLFIEKNNGIFSNCTIKSINLISKFKLDNQFHDRYIFNIRWNPKRNQSTYEKNNPKKYERNFTH